MLRILVFVFALVLASIQSSADLDEEGCLHDGTRYPEGSELCLSGTLKRCEDGAWADIGMCEDD